MSTPTSRESLAWPQILTIYRHELIASGLMAFVHIIIVYILFYSLKEYFGTSLGLLLAILILLLLLLLVFTFVLFMRYVAKKFVIIPLMQEIDKMIAAHEETLKPNMEAAYTAKEAELLDKLEARVVKAHKESATLELSSEQEQLKMDTYESLKEIKSISSTFEGMITKHDEIITQRFEDLISRHDETVTSRFQKMLREVEEKVEEIEFPKQKFNMLKTKYDVDLKPMRLQEYDDPAGFHRVKIGLINGVKESVFATYVIDRYSQLPLETEDDINYFNGNIEANKRIRAKHADDVKKYAIHRIFIISQDALENHEKRHEFPARIARHVSAGFSITMILKDRLDERLRLDFAIFDDEIVFELRMGDLGQGSRKGIIYFDEAIVQSVYKEKYREIESGSCAPDKFWSKYHIKP